MTPAIDLLKKLNIKHAVHEYVHDAQHESFGLEAAEKLQLPAEQVFKTLVVELDSGKFAVAILPVTQMLSMKLVAKSLKAKKADMADKIAVQRSTGYVLGGVSPLAQKKRLVTVIDKSAESFNTIFVSGGKRGLEIEIAPMDLAKATSSLFAAITL